MQDLVLGLRVTFEDFSLFILCGEYSPGSEFSAGVDSEEDFTRVGGGFCHLHCAGGGALGAFPERFGGVEGNAKDGQTVFIRRTKITPRAQNLLLPQRRRKQVC
jgi:hypothetical protein